MSADSHVKPTLIQLVRLDNIASICVCIVATFTLFLGVNILFGIQLFLGVRSSRVSAEDYPIVMIIGVGAAGGFLAFRLFWLNQFRQRAIVVLGSVISAVHCANGAMVVRYQYEVKSEFLEGKSDLNRLHPFRNLEVGSGVKLLVDAERTHQSLIFDKVSGRKDHIGQ